MCLQRWLRQSRLCISVIVRYLRQPTNQGGLIEHLSMSMRCQTIIAEPS